MFENQSVSHPHAIREIPEVSSYFMNFIIFVSVREHESLNPIPHTVNILHESPPHHHHHPLLIFQLFLNSRSPNFVLLRNSACSFQKCKNNHHQKLQQISDLREISQYKDQWEGFDEFIGGRGEGMRNRVKFH